MSRVVVITPPVGPNVTLAQAKAQCRAGGFDDDDTLIQGYLLTAFQWIDGPAGWLGRSLMPQTLELRQRIFTRSGRPHRDDFFGDVHHGEDDPWSPRIRLPYGPVQSVEQVTYTDDNGLPQTLDPSSYELDGDEIVPVYGGAWPATRGDPNAVCIRYSAGYPLDGGSGVPLPTTPAPIQTAILLLISHFYNHPDAVVGVENRDSSTEMPLGVTALLTPFQRLD